MVFGSFNVHDEFFAKHQPNFLADIVRVLMHNGLEFNYYDVLVMAIDKQVLREQADTTRWHIERDSSFPVQRRLNFEMSVKNLYESLPTVGVCQRFSPWSTSRMTLIDNESDVLMSCRKPREVLAPCKDPIVTGPLTNAEAAVRSSAGF